MTLLTNIGCLVRITDNGSKYLHADQTDNLSILHNAKLVISDKIKWIGGGDDLIPTEYLIDKTIDCAGRTVFPAFIDPHTHYPFAGNRAGEFAMRLAGATYEEIAANGGGIQNTVKATAKATLEELTGNVISRSKIANSFGITCVEMKSGYSLSKEGELRQLEAIKVAADTIKLKAVPTLLAAHDFPKELKSSPDGRRKYIDLIKNEIIPEVAERKLAKYNDVFIDNGYYTVDEGIEVLQAGLDHGLAPRAHCDELVDTGSSKAVADIGGVSVDHLIRINDEGIKALKTNGTVACLLPGTSYFIRKPYAPARKILDSGVITALATDCNPGSSYTENIQLIMQLACINAGMTVNEAIAAVTINAAYALGLSEERGSIEVGKTADLAIMDITTPEELIYHHGINHTWQTWHVGQLIWEK
jgi:imidazolonepropionase